MRVKAIVIRTASHVLSAISQNRLRRASARARTAELRARPPALREFAPHASGSVSIDTASRATASGVNASWISSGTIRSPAIRLTIANVSTLTNGRPIRYVERRHPVDDHHRRVVQRASARSPCPTRSARRRPPPAPRRCRPRRSRRRARLRAGVEQAVVEVRRARDHELRVRARSRESAGRGDEVGRMRRTSFGPAARQHRNRRRVGIAAPSRARNAVADASLRREIDQRMADELHRHAGLAIDRLLERKDHEHAIGDLANRLDPPGTPRPDLRADVVDDRDAEPLARRARGGKLKSEIVDDDERVGRSGLAASTSRRFAARKCRHLRDDLGEAGDRQAAVVLEETSAGRGELRPAQPADVDDR